MLRTGARARASARAHARARDCWSLTGVHHDTMANQLQLKVVSKSGEHYFTSTESPNFGDLVSAILILTSILILGWHYCWPLLFNHQV